MPWKQLGWRVAIPAAVVAIAAALFLGNLLRAKKPAAKTAATAPAVSHSAPAAISESAAIAIGWGAAFNERVPGVPYSAPFYDAAIRPVTFPKISGCIEIRNDMRTHCYCETQQGTRITSISTAQCQYWLRNGWFDFSRPDDGEGSSQSSASSASYSEDGGRAAEVPTAPAAAAIPVPAHS